MAIISNVLDFSKYGYSAVDFSKGLNANNSYIDDKYFILANNVTFSTVSNGNTSIDGTANAPATTIYDVAFMMADYKKPTTTSTTITAPPTVNNTTSSTPQSVVIETTVTPVAPPATEPPTVVAVEPPKTETQPEVITTQPITEETNNPTTENNTDDKDNSLEENFIKRHRHHKHNHGHHYGHFKHHHHNHIHDKDETKTTEKPVEQTEIAKDSRGIWGDPHYTTKGANGEDINFMHCGESGKTYNVFEGDGYKVEGLYDNRGWSNGVTFVVDTTVKAGNDTIKYNLDGKTSVNGEILKNGTVTLKDGTKVNVNGKSMTILSREGDSKMDFTNNDGICIDPEGKFGNLSGILGKSISLGKALTEEEANKYTLSDLI
jgi:hypothetical protein